MNPLFCCFIQQVHTYDDTACNLHSLEYEIQIPFQTRCIAHYDNRICVTKTDKVPGDFLLRRVCHERISARYIHHFVRKFFGTAVPRCVHNRFSRPVSCMLVQVRQIIKNRTFPYIRVARNRNNAFSVHTILLPAAES